MPRRPDHDGPPGDVPPREEMQRAVKALALGVLLALALVALARRGRDLSARSSG